MIKSPATRFDLTNKIEARAKKFGPRPRHVLANAASAMRTTIVVLALLPLARPWSLTSPAARPNGRSNAVTGRATIGMAESMRARRERLIREIEAPIARREPDGPAIDDPAAPLALAACRAGDARKARDVKAFRVAHLTSATNFFVNMCGTSKAQISAIVRNVEDELGEQFGVRAHRQGKAVSGWVCLDYDAVVVNVFGEREREFYGMERFWKAAQDLDLSDVLVPNDAAGMDGGDEGAAGWGEDEDDVDDWVLGDDSDWDLGSELGDESGGGGEAAGGGAQAAQAGLSGGKAWAPSPGAASWGDKAEAGEDEDWEEDWEGAEGGSQIAGLEEWVGVGGKAAVDDGPLAEVSVDDDEEEAADARAAQQAQAQGVPESDEEADGDWALGDERLRAIVDRAEGAAEARGGGWRKMMEEDGFSLEEGDDGVLGLPDGVEFDEWDDEDEED